MRKLQKGDLLEVTIDKLVSGGEGLGKVFGYPVFVPGGLPGDHGAVEMVSVKKDYGRGLMVQRWDDGPTRVVPPCPLTESCGGCQWQHLDYTAQLENKRALLIETLSRLGKLPEVELENWVKAPLGMQDPWRYRNKGQFPFQTIEGQARGGFFAPRSHTLVPIQDCLIHPPAMNAALNQVEAALNQLNIPIYDEKTHSGFLRHVLIRESTTHPQILVGLVTRDWEHPALAALVEKLSLEIPNLVGLVQNRNPEPGNRILGRETRTLWGKDSLKESLGDLHFSISLPSFFQVNSQQTVVLYETINALAELSGSETVVDAFAGAGTIGLWLAKQAKQVYCLESVNEAIADGKINRALNQIENLEFRQGAVEKLLPDLLAQTKADLVILDPPRKGCEPAVLASLIRSEVPKVIYVSCNPATLARDLALLAEHYEISAIQPIDLFPHTHHLETVVLLTRGAADLDAANETLAS